MLTCPEAARFVLVTGAHLFRPSYPRSKERLIGPWAVFYHDGGFHSKMRKLVHGSLSLDRVRTMVPAIEAIAVSTLDSCCNGSRAVNTYHEMKKVCGPIFLFDNQMSKRALGISTNSRTLKVTTGPKSFLKGK